jgi:7-cyano-7-deazaguanine synthase
MVDEASERGQETAVLFSAGLDSAVLVAHEAQRAPVRPIYVAAGLAWEAAEERCAARLIASGAFGPRVGPVVRLAVDMRDVYPASHWAIRGEPPGYHTPDEDVYIDGRNVVLLAKASVWCARHGIARLVIGPLAGNPFPDATPEFFRAMARALSLGLAHEIAIAAPLAALHKEDVIRMGASLGVPLALTLSCMNPEGDSHCGRCSKCRERQHAFAASGVEDRTAYAARPPEVRAPDSGL